MSKNHKPDHKPDPKQDPSPDAKRDRPDNPATPAAAPLAGTVVDRRLFADRRRVVVDGQEMDLTTGQPAQNRRAADRTGDKPGEPQTGLDRRRGPGRRLSDFTRSAEEGEMTREQFMFLMAIDEFKKANDRSFPTWTDVLEVVRLLGYRKTAKSELTLRRAEDWCEGADAPSNVRPDNWAMRPKGAKIGPKKDAA